MKEISFDEAIGLSMLGKVNLSLLTSNVRGDIFMDTLKSSEDSDYIEYFSPTENTWEEWGKYTISEILHNLLPSGKWENTLLKIYLLEEKYDSIQR